MLLVPWVIPPAMSTLAWLWLFDPSYSAFNWVLELFGIAGVHWTGDAYWARFSVTWSTVWIGAPFFMIMYLSGAQVGAGGALRGRRPSTAPTGGSASGTSPADDAQTSWRSRAVLADRHVRQFRHRAHHHGRRADRQDARVRDLGRSGSASRATTSRSAPRVAVHGADPGHRRDLHPARHHQRAREMS
jgi:hypothetical protein